MRDFREKLRLAWRYGGLRPRVLALGLCAYAHVLFALIGVGVGLRTPTVAELEYGVLFFILGMEARDFTLRRHREGGY